jgi:hypothetical protein
MTEAATTDFFGTTSGQVTKDNFYRVLIISFVAEVVTLGFIPPRFDRADDALAIFQRSLPTRQSRRGQGRLTSASQKLWNNFQTSGLDAITFLRNKAGVPTADAALENFARESEALLVSSVARRAGLAVFRSASTVELFLSGLKSIADKTTAAMQSANP